MPDINISAQLENAKKHLYGVSRKIGSARKGALAGATGLLLLVGDSASAVKQRAKNVKDVVVSTKKQKKTREVIEVKKSTVVALLVVLAAVAGALAALYCYVLRRERELDEYEQLLFSEDFDDMLDVEELPEEDAQEVEAI